MDEYRIVTVPENTPNATEQLGTKRKFWFQGEDSVNYLFKEARPNTGEDWAEKAASELCELLAIPHAAYDLAEWKSRRGVVSANFVSKGTKLILGNELLARIVDEYPAKKFFQVSEHTLDRVLSILESEQMQRPPGWRGFLGVGDAADTFVGYLMLDAWIANQDRHHENWGLLVASGEVPYLAPSYDHASSLGRNENDAARQDRLTTRDQGRAIESYVEKARSAFYSTPAEAKPMSTLDAFLAAGKRNSRAARAWLERLESVESSAVGAIFRRIPQKRITAIAVEFAQRMLELNQQRLLSLKGDL